MPRKSYHHPYITTAFIGAVTVSVFFIFTGILFYKCSSSEPKSECIQPRVPALWRGSSGACIDVQDSVLGDIIPGSRVNLYRVSSTEFAVVMEEIRTQRPSEWSVVDDRKRFGFVCLSQGDYAFVIPASSYNKSVGAPFPDEVECGSLFIDIVFQGGDWRYAVGAFFINESCRQA